MIIIVKKNYEIGASIRIAVMFKHWAYSSPQLNLVWVQKVTILYKTVSLNWITFVRFTIKCTNLLNVL